MPLIFWHAQSGQSSRERDALVTVIECRHLCREAAPEIIVLQQPADAPSTTVHFLKVIRTLNPSPDYSWLSE